MVEESPELFCDLPPYISVSFKIQLIKKMVKGKGKLVPSSLLLKWFLTAAAVIPLT